jgi:hypothetical protein
VDVIFVTTGERPPSDERKYRQHRGDGIEPASERGQILLMKGRDLRILLPNVSQRVRLSLAQWLTGQVANSDLARANYAGE